MALEPRTRVGPYEVLALMGAGGMGEVYRARDERLGREVAIKVLLAAAARDPERRQRFEQEARAVGALNHPNVLAIHDVGDHEGTPYLVSELLDGETLRDRLDATSRLPTRKAVDYATQVAQGLAAAHDKGILHRDLKPENLFLTRDGGVKILDFGLAKLTEPDLESDTDAPTRTRHTQAGTVVGTVGYMSPEQVRGRDVDHRSDIFALGAVLYEMLAGRRAFAEETPAETMTAILKHEPAGPPDSDHRVPLGIERITRRCLEKKPEERFQSARDLAFHLQVQSTASGSAASPVTGQPRRRWPNRVTLVVLGVVLLAAVGRLVEWMASREGPPPTTRLNLVFPANAPPDLGSNESLALSPDGRRLVYAGFVEGQRRLLLRPLDRYDVTPIPGTEGGYGPFVSPDGEWIGFYAEGKLKKVPMGGGPSVTLADNVWDAHGASWAEDGTVVFTRAVLLGLHRVPDTGGTPTELTEVDASRGEVSHLSPQILPGRRSVLFTVLRQDGPQIEIVDLDSGERKVVAQDGGHARYLETGHIVFVRSGALLAAPFDAAPRDLPHAAGAHRPRGPGESSRRRAGPLRNAPTLPGRRAAGPQRPRRASGSLAVRALPGRPRAPRDRRRQLHAGVVSGRVARGLLLEPV
jgi:serine/threonine-protein kinase